MTQTASAMFDILNRSCCLVQFGVKEDPPNTNWYETEQMVITKTTFKGHQVNLGRNVSQ